MTEYISVFGQIKGTKRGGAPIDLDDAANIGHLLARDSTHGTYGEFEGAYWKSKISTWVSKAALVDQVTALGTPGEFSFRLRLDAILFNPMLGGIQHLIGVLAGDLGILQVRGLDLAPIKITAVEFPNSWQESIRNLYRLNRSHSIDDIRKAFKLEADEPLLAFSLKPRMGLTKEGLQEITLAVLAEGFHIVELDTRNLDLRGKTVEFFLELAKRSVDVGKGKRVTRFSINLSVSAQIALNICGAFNEKVPAPMPVKVDGGFDGISTLQALRSSYRRENDKDTPYITTYPLFRSIIKNRIADDTFLNALVWSGSDIIYPGNAPNLGGYRQLDHSAAGALASSVDRYWKIISSGFPMPTVAGGVYPGQLQAYYELLGPEVGYFLGGAVALHKDGPVKGAELCVKILKAARNLRKQAGMNFAAEIKDDLKVAAENAIEIPAGADGNTFRYFPVADLAKVAGLKPWFKR
jgi:hypothetical protein